jgi:hypothetical protein
MDLPFWALGLRHPLSCKATGPEVHAETCPLGLKVEYVFPAADGSDTINLTWYDGQRNRASLITSYRPFSCMH